MNLPFYIKKTILLIENSGYYAHVVGGCVRDAVMGRIPSDYDIATNAPPEKIIDIFRIYGCSGRAAKFGTVAVNMDGNKVEITTYRIESSYADNRRPDEVIFADDIRIDLSRRDFTVNAIAYSDKEGFIDPFYGAEDIRNKIIRCVNDAELRFSEDGLRILRAVRFASVLGFDIEKETSIQIIKQRELLLKLPAERIFPEFSKLLCGERAEYIIKKYRLVLEVVFPELKEIGDDEYNIMAESIGFISDTGYTEDKITIRLCVMCHFLEPFRPDICGIIIRRFKINNRISDKLKKIISFCRKVINPRKIELRKLVSEIGFENTFCLIGYKKAVSFKTGDIKTAEMFLECAVITDEIKKNGDCVSLAGLALGGNDLEEMGFIGAEIGKCLRKLLVFVMEEKIANERNSLLNFAKTII